MYTDVFCRVYNEFGWNYYPEAFGQELLQWLKRNAFQPRSALDIGCGTGVLCGILKDAGVDAWGMDLSPEMIRIARENYPGIPFYEGDMCTFAPGKQFDLITATGDVLNHLPTLEDLRQVFANVYDLLNPGGYFIFDLLNPNEAPEGEPFLLDFSPQVQAIFQITRPEEALVKLEIQVFEDGKKAFTQAILETIHDADAVQALLEQARFSVSRGNTLIPDPDRRSTTWYFIARK